MGNKKQREKERKRRIKGKQEEAKLLSKGGNVSISSCSVEIFEFLHTPAFILFTTPESAGQPEANIALYVPQEIYGDKITREEIAALVTSSTELLSETFINLEQYGYALLAQKPGYEYDKSNGFYFCRTFCLKNNFLSVGGFDDEVLAEIIKHPELLARIIMDELWKIGQEFGKAMKNE